MRRDATREYTGHGVVSRDALHRETHLPQLRVRVLAKRIQVGPDGALACTTHRSESNAVSETRSHEAGASVRAEVGAHD
jgi:hypothetical protein